MNRSFQNCWRGVYSLWVTFWLVFALPFIAFQLVWPLYISSFATYVVFAVTFIAWLVFAGVSVWRSASNHRIKAIGYLAQGIILIYGLGSIYGLTGDLIFYAKSFT